MAGMFYNLQEIADKLGGSVEQAEELVNQHKLREFRDGSNVLYKTAEVDPLIIGAAAEDVIDLDTGGEEELVGLAPDVEESVELAGEEEEEEEAVELISDTAGVTPEESVLDIADDTGDATSQGSAPGILESAADEDTFQVPADDDTLGLVPEEDTLASAGSGAESVANLLASDESEFDLGAMDTASEEAVSEESINALLADESISTPLDDAPAGSAADAISDLTAADTHGATTGINVLAGSDAEYQLAADSKADTQDADFEDEFGDLDDDINLDTVGSGSGLLDLSLQADDTSLGAVLDDILPAVEEGEAAMPSADDFGVGDDDAEGMFDDAPAGMPAAMPIGATAAAGHYVELPADAASNACGIALFFPIIAIVFGIIVVLNGFTGVSAEILNMIEEYLVWVVAGLGGVTLLVIVIGMAMGGGSGQPKAAKKKKEKAKKPKNKKEKKPKKKKKK
jgi:hypothetical protein